MKHLWHTHMYICMETFFLQKQKKRNGAKYVESEKDLGRDDRKEI